jgi:hypothetical protein
LPGHRAADKSLKHPLRIKREIYRMAFGALILPGEMKAMMKGGMMMRENG